MRWKTTPKMADDMHEDSDVYDYLFKIVLIGREFAVVWANL